ncbi:MAG: flagellar hook-basal body complex protein [Armatimonadetes bacterium]|nr:flagellar hook-basal body complex protein [Armatimonadota bacterium]
MLDGMHMATQGMMAMSAQQDLITNNLANVGTAGFRKEGIVVSSFTDILNTEMGSSFTQAGGEISAVSGLQATTGLHHKSVTVTAQGGLKESGNPFDLALDDNGKGYFTVQTSRGIEFSRAGTFQLSTSGYLVTRDGSFVLGHKGKVKIDGSDFKVDDQGMIHVDGKPVDRLLISTFEDPRDLQRSGDTNFTAAQPRVRATTDFRVKQGFVEQANVNALHEMVGLMQVMRNYEANQKAIQAHDSKLQKAISEIGRVR